MISVMMPVYNAAPYLRESIESILNQTYRDIELVIVNDGSTDESEDIILSYNDPRIKYVKQENSGETAARNTALDHMTGEFISFQRADDISLPVRFETLLRHFTSDDVSIVHSDMLAFDNNNRPVRYYQSFRLDQERMLRFLLKEGTPFNNTSFVLRSEVMEGFRYDTTIQMGTDSDMVFRVMRGRTTVHVPEPLMLYRCHEGNVTHASFSSNSVNRLIERHTLQELVPELDWEAEDYAESTARAAAIVAYFLAGRRFFDEAAKWLRKAERMSYSRESELFVAGMASAVAGQYAEAYEHLSSIQNKDHVVENYLGEVVCSLGQFDKGTAHFYRALKMKPAYNEPIDNLRGLGARRSFNPIDNRWNKFR